MKLQPDPPSFVLLHLTSMRSSAGVAAEGRIRGVALLARPRESGGESQPAMGGKADKCKEGCGWAWTTFVTAVFEYDTAKIVHIKNKKVGIMNRLVQLAIVGYIIG